MDGGEGRGGCARRCKPNGKQRREKGANGNERKERGWAFRGAEEVRPSGARRAATGTSALEIKVARPAKLCQRAQSLRPPVRAQTSVMSVEACGPMAAPHAAPGPRCVRAGGCAALPAQPRFPWPRSERPIPKAPPPLETITGPSRCLTWVQCPRTVHPPFNTWLDAYSTNIHCPFAVDTTRTATSVTQAGMCTVLGYCTRVPFVQLSSLCHARANESSAHMRGVKTDPCAGTCACRCSQSAPQCRTRIGERC